MFQVDADWRTPEATALELEKVVGHGFEFKGPGFYLQDNETNLVMPWREDLPWARPSLWLADAKFVLYHWNYPYSELIFSQISLIPIRLDLRSYFTETHAKIIMDLKLLIADIDQLDALNIECNFDLTSIRQRLLAMLPNTDEQS